MAVHEQLKDDPSYAAFWIGRNEEGERKAVEKEGLPFIPIRSGKLRRYFSFSNVLDVANLVVAFFQALCVLIRKRPDMLFSKGGFVSVPPVYAAALLRIPVISHESDCSAGLATKLNAPMSSLICFGYEEAAQGFASPKVRITGNPVRSALFATEAREMPFLGEVDKLVLVLGGSQGSQRINCLVRSNLEELTKLAFVYHQAGPRDCEGRTHDNYREVGLIGDELGALYRQSTLVVSRSGAGTLAELALFGCASLLIPLSTQSSRGDQVENAKALEQRGAARVLSEDASEDEFLSLVKTLLEDDRQREDLKTAISKTAFNDSAKQIADIVRSKEK